MVCLLVPRSVCSLWFRRLAIIDDDEEAFVSFSLAVCVLPKLQLSIKSFSGCNTMWLFIWFTITTTTTTKIKLQLGDYDYGSEDDDGEGDDDDDYPVTQKWCAINIVPICYSKSVNQQSLYRWVNNFITSLNKWRPYKGLTSSHHESTSVIFLQFQKWN